MEVTSCTYCDLPEIKARTIFRNQIVWAFPTNIPIVPGHTIICLVRHVRTFDELTSEEKNAIFELVRKIKTALKEIYGAEGFHHAWNEGPVAG